MSSSLLPRKRKNTLLDGLASPSLLLGGLRSLSRFMTDKDMVFFMRTCSFLQNKEFPKITLGVHIHVRTRLYVDTCMCCNGPDKMGVSGITSHVDGLLIMVI